MIDLKFTDEVKFFCFSDYAILICITSYYSSKYLTCLALLNIQIFIESDFMFDYFIVTKTCGLIFVYTCRLIVMY